MKQRVARVLVDGPMATRAWRVLLLGQIVLVCWLALTPRPPPEFDFGWDKLNHTLAFMALALAAWLAYPDSQRQRGLSLAGLLALGGVIELLQLFVPGRSADWADLVGDALGIVAGALLGAVLLWWASSQARGR